MNSYAMRWIWNAAIVSALGYAGVASMPSVLEGRALAAQRGAGNCDSKPRFTRPVCDSQPNKNCQAKVAKCQSGTQRECGINGGNAACTNVTVCVAASNDTLDPDCTPPPE